MQVRFSPLYCEGVGLSDGEVMERLWSYLRRYTRMTKEMRPSHRVDVLSHALMYYGLKTKQKLRKLYHLATSIIYTIFHHDTMHVNTSATLLVLRWKRAKNSYAVAFQTYQELKSMCDGKY